MANNRRQLRKQVFQDVVLGEHARDVQGVIDSLAPTVTKRPETQYTEPFTLAAGDEEPESIELVRIVNLQSPETPVQCGSLCHWIWRPQLGGAQILSIDGLTPNNEVKYRLTFRITFSSVA